MQLSQAVQIRIMDICDEQNITLSKLSKNSKLPTSTVYSIFYEKSKNPKLQTIQDICEGLNISLSNFFDDPVFKRIDLNDLN